LSPLSFSHWFTILRTLKSKAAAIGRTPKGCMSNFVVIDHSVKRIGGHNYEYALHILAAAERQGYHPVLAVNRRFFERQRLPPSWQLLTVFRHTTYEAARLAARQWRLDPHGDLLAELAGRLSLPVEKRASQSWLPRLPAGLRRHLIRRHENSRRRMVDHFAEDLAQLFGQLRSAPGDHIFIPTLSEDDLVGLLAFFGRHSSAVSAATWHLQFHFSVYDGREPDAAQNTRLQGLKQLFARAATTLPYDRVRFYTTTEILAEQFNGLGAATFEALPYPVNPALLEKTRRVRLANSPVRVTCAGGVRPEKGTAGLGGVVNPLWREYFDTRRLQLVVQAKRLGKLPRDLRRHARYDRQSAAPRECIEQPPKVAVVRWPLSSESYLDLIRDSDIGLLLYDAQQYYARCSGVMVEMLKAGVPVIVPAGCWMGDQIAEPIFAHRDKLCRELPTVARLTPVDADWEAGRAQRYYLWRRDARLLVGGEAGCPQTRLAVPPSASHLCVRFRFATSNPPGSCLELSTHSRNAGQGQAESQREIVGARRLNASLPVLFTLASDAREIQLSWQNAFASHMLELADVEFLVLSADQGACPLGAVGLVSAGLDQAPRLLRDMVDHYGHYRRTAEALAPAWGRWHSPEKVVRLLIADRAAQRRCAA
jgi:hypothetical protein